MATLLKGLPVAKALTEQLATRTRELKDKGITPTLAIVRVGERSDDLAYERGACKRCEAVGIAVRKFVLSEGCTQGELLSTIEAINADAGIHGCLMFRPLPASLDEDAACAALDPAKDVDCATAGSLYGVFAGRRVGFPPCTAEACIEVLDHYGYNLAGAEVTVIGRSLVIGKPVSMMLQARNATVTMCHTRTRDLAAACRRADILVVAAGHIGTVGADAVREGQVVLDVGINWDDAAGKLCGDVLFDEVEPVVDAITPVPGGIGTVTTAVLAKHVVAAAERC
ncbi:MAG: bifunctional 5,10-methylene-tetrahydrofolate dehydrogenase/5,10-methylene-tetrahydrofolate cyclohydrolase [Atopobiaceae bacterium]|nr:bifunctional 5,10-methylene-tetrahydrofolate dehydrogenase/5,10-methylene-tetrahydrofolate cyclohydrolase [Atopobiaceae bacterium]